jgi:hypothetical protein
VAESPRPPPARQDRALREYRRRDDDLGPSVTGFGEDIPAFMLLPRRATFAGHDEAA